MGISQKQEFAAVLFMLLCGVLCGILYDIFRISRVLLRLSSYTRTGEKFAAVRLPLIGCSASWSKQKIPILLKNILLGAGDTLFGVVSGCLFSIFLAHYANGVFRWFFLVSACIGFFLYYFTLGYIVMTASEIIAGIIRIVFRYFAWFVMLPFRALKFALKAVISRIYRHLFIPIKKSARFRLEIRYTEKIKKELPNELILSYERGD